MPYALPLASTDTPNLFMIQPYIFSVVLLILTLGVVKEPGKKGEER
jgi:hypothetical protein